MKRLMLVGKTGVGKTSLTQRITGQSLGYKKTQSVDYLANLIDTPGEYVENKAYYKALIVSATEADIVGLVQPADALESSFPPQFASAFNCEVIGIVTKTDLISDTSVAEQFLIDAGVAKIYRVSNVTEMGIQAIQALLHEAS